MTRESGPEDRSQRTVAELLAQYGRSGAGGTPRRRRRREEDDEPNETAPHAIIGRVLSESGRMRAITDDGPEDAEPRSYPRYDTPSRRRLRAPEPEPEAAAPQAPGPAAAQAPPQSPPPPPAPPKPLAKPKPTAKSAPRPAPPPGASFPPAPADVDHTVPVPPVRPGAPDLQPTLAGADVLADTTQVPPVRVYPEEPAHPQPPTASRIPVPPAGPLTRPGMAPPAPDTAEGLTEQLPRVAEPAAAEPPKRPELTGPGTERWYPDDFDDEDSEPGGTEAVDAAAPPAGLDDADEIAEPDEAEEAERSPAKEWLVMVAQLGVGLIGGGALWWAFQWLWKWQAPVALVVALLVTLGLVLVVRVLRKADDLQTTLLAVLVGLVVTMSPAALLLVAR
ncbi:hypothetical protein GCM10012275_45210 [Longimycelium tulufanense]|uniref:Transmembrane protein n=1 Tax=Longimycelium tulufanense TaxID=907463 RepID=A0A8J3CHZ9_9PSEU|nr:hypothetical protein [Longimycelium tulufanense]GGM69685.1 hypothetical protein GCM10012275_45210 [Longimycelium tulufanense]